MSNWTIDDSTEHFQIKLWTGNATNRTIDLDENATMQPDFSWVKSRSNTYEPYLQNSTSGTSKYLRSHSSASEQNGTIVTYNSSGFGIGSGAENNTNNTTNVGWFWKANGGTTSSMTGGNINSVVQANQTAGFSIVTWSGNDATGQSVNHGLGATPTFIMAKRTNGTADWYVYHRSLGNTKHMHLNNQNAVSTTSDWGNYGPDANSFYTNNTGTCISGQDYIAFCFAPIQGYSKFDYYTGTGNADGPFVYCGFKPGLVIIRNTTNSGYLWWMLDSKRPGFNFTDQILYTDGTYAEYDGSGHATNMGIDILSNGFKVKTTNTAINNDGSNNIYMAWAENPFVSSEGVPTTAN